MKKYVLTILSICLIVLLSSCSNKVNFIEEDGQKKYKKENGEFARAEWVTIDGNDYNFDLNGYLQTDKWIDDYYVGKDGKKLVKAWYNDEKDGKSYYLSSTGKYLKDTLATIDGKDYYFDSDGSLIKGKIFENSEGKSMYADDKGVVNNSDSLVTIDGDTYFIDKMGIIFKNDWKQVGKDWYYFDENGKMKKNQWHDATYYLGDDGKMLVNTKTPDGYEVDKNGNVLEKYKDEIAAKDFKYLYKKYCLDPYFEVGSNNKPYVAWAEVGEDGSYISLDSNPEDIDDNSYRHYSNTYGSEVINVTQTLLKIFGFHDYVYKNIVSTTYADGKQEETSENIIVTWKFHPDKGIEIMFKKKNE